MKARRRPVVIDFFPAQELTTLKRWVESFGDDFDHHFVLNRDSLHVKTLEGNSYAVTSDDVIIRGIEGEYYPCKKTIFDQTYEVVQ
ncbi:MAG TPA: hypothetical protein PLU10_02345 [Chitinophagaceae bacterium]|nr:hypothetical protein [Chitinophagaceae bacterium]